MVALSLSRALASIVVAAVLAATASPASAQSVPDDFLITLERTACFGECPIYSVSIDARGTVTYEGTKFVRVEGREKDRIPMSGVAALLATAERIRFFDLRNRYRTIRNPDGTETMVTDLPTAFVSIRAGGRTKRVEDYFGAPQGLKQLEEQIDETARTNRWIRLDLTTLRQMVQGGWVPSAEEGAELLRNALQHDEVDVVKGLLEIGADPNAAYYGTNTPPLMMVRSAAAARVLLEAGANPFARNDNGGTPLGWAVYLSPDVAEVLLKAGALVNEPTDSDGRTALWGAACRGNVGVLTLLIAAGADVTNRARGKSALECAREAKESARALKPSVLGGKRPFVQDYDGVIAVLERAIARGQRH